MSLVFSDHEVHDYIQVEQKCYALVFLPLIQDLNVLSPDLLWTSPALSAITIIMILPGLGAWSLRDRREAAAVWAAEVAREVLAAGGGAAGALWQPWYDASVGVGSSHSEHASGDIFRPLIHNKYWDHGNNTLKLSWITIGASLGQTIYIHLGTRNILQYNLFVGLSQFTYDRKYKSSPLTSAAVDLCGDSLGVAAVAAIARKLLINDTTVGLPLVPQLRRGRAIIWLCQCWHISGLSRRRLASVLENFIG